MVKAPSEHAEQCALMGWWEYQARAKRLAPELFFAIPNGGNRNAATGARLKAEGVRAGVPDLMLAIPSKGFSGLFIELKRRSGGVLGAKQKSMLAILAANGYAAEVCQGFEAAKETICRYLGWEFVKRDGQGRLPKGRKDPRLLENWGDMEDED